jgi:hypothetical protein
MVVDRFMQQDLEIQYLFGEVSKLFFVFFFSALTIIKKPFQLNPPHAFLFYDEPDVEKRAQEFHILSSILLRDDAGLLVKCRHDVATSKPLPFGQHGFFVLLPGKNGTLLMKVTTNSEPKKERKSVFSDLERKSPSHVSNRPSQQPSAIEQPLKCALKFN